MKAAPRKKQRRAAPPPHPSTSPIIWANFNWKWIVGVFGGAGVILGAIVAYDKAHPILEPLTPASSGYVRSYANETASKKFEPVSKWQQEYDAFRIEQTLELAKLALVNLEENHRKAEKEQKASPSSVVLAETVTRLERQVRDTKKRIEEYEAALFAKRAAR